MATDTLDEYRDAIFEIAEAIAPTWERRRAEVEELSAPFREWMLRALRPREGDTVLELAAVRARHATGLHIPIANSTIAQLRNLVAAS